VNARASAKEIFADALDAPLSERDRFVEQACAGDGALLAEVRSLLARHERGRGFMAAPTADGGRPAEPWPLAEQPGQTIGRYRLLQLLGQGGFGAVFMAEQREPVVRKVALKIIKWGMDTRAVIARFEAERQALALMDHPNIARVLDAGATEMGRPYFVMELVTGDPITDYCDRHQLPIDERLALFEQVCRAVQHAHTKGIIHRDLKPSNVLVSTTDGRPLAKVIDFGIAKATQARLTEKTLFTEHRALIGTPEYMSPEQAEGLLDIDTRTDVYSLGVLLYQLLVGVTPFDGETLRSAAYGEIQRIIREVEPPAPSTRLSALRGSLAGIAASRRVEPARLSSALRGELDWIVMKCLEKDRSRRYETAAALALDIQRRLAGEPVAAAPPSASYRLRKFARRHRRLLAAAALVAVSLVAGLAATTYGLVRALRAEALANDRLAQAEQARAEAVASKDQAERMVRIAEAVTEFFTHDLLDLRPRPAGAPPITVRELLDAVPARIDRYFKSEPAVEGIIRERVGQLYRRMGDVARSEEYLVAAIPLLEQGLGPDKKVSLSAVHRLGELRMDQRRFDEAAALFDKAYQGRLRAWGTEYPFTMGSLGRRGTARVYAGQHEEGLSDLLEARRFYEQKDGPESRNFAVATMTLADALVHTRQFEEARALSRSLLDTILARGGVLAGLEWPVRETLAEACLGLGQADAALAEADAALRIMEGVYPPGHLVFIEVRKVRGRTLAAMGRPQDALTELEACYGIGADTYGAKSAECREVVSLATPVAAATGDGETIERWRARGVQAGSP
jgi:serine/threonine protein kinase